MSDQDEFVSIETLNHNHINEKYLDESNQEELEDGSIYIYQLQAKKNNTNAIIIKAGIIKEPHDVLIKEFDIDKFRCFMVSKLYTLGQLQQSDEYCRFNMIRIIIYNKNQNTTPFAQLCYNFNTFVHKQNNKSIIEYLSEPTKKIELYGFFSVTLHYNENSNPKYINLENIKKYCGQNEMMITLTKWLLDKQVKEILNKVA